jgi:hypothetical protein
MWVLTHSFGETLRKSIIIICFETRLKVREIFTRGATVSFLQEKHQIHMDQQMQYQVRKCPERKHILLVTLTISEFRHEHRNIPLLTVLLCPTSHILQQDSWLHIRAHFGFICLSLSNER